MNEIVNKFLLAGDKFMTKKHLREPRITYSTCEPFTKIKERIQKFTETGDSKYIYHNELDKAYFQHDMAYCVFKDLARRTASDKILCNKVFNMLKICNIMDINVDMPQWSINFLRKNCRSGIKTEDISNQQLAEELHKPIIRKFNKREVKSPFTDNIWVEELPDMQLISKFNNRIRFFFNVLLIFTANVHALFL